MHRSSRTASDGRTGKAVIKELQLLQGRERCRRAFDGDRSASCERGRMEASGRAHHDGKSCANEWQGGNGVAVGQARVREDEADWMR